MGRANAALDTTFATIGAVCWSVQIIPQLIKSYRRKDTAGLSAEMLLIWIIGGTFLGAYAFLENLSIPLLIQPQLFCFFAALAWGQCLHYDQGKSARRAIIITTLVVVLVGGFEVMFYYTGKIASSHGHNQVTTAWGVLAAVFIVIGLLPQFYEVWKYKAVIGISLVFLAVDLAGGVFSTLSLVFAEGEFDTLASVCYGAVAVLELFIFILVPILNPAHRRRLAASQKADADALSGSANSSAHDEENATATPKQQQKETAAELEKPQAAVEARGRTGERGVLGWMDEGVCEDEEMRRKVSVDGVKRPESAERRGGRNESPAGGTMAQ